MAKHTVKLHKWNRHGILETLEHIFDTRAAAQEFAANADCHSVKIYNSSGNLINEMVKTPAPTPAYA